MDQLGNQETRKRRFHVSDILSITTDRLVSTRHLEGVYEICNFMTGDNLFTHQLPRASRECAPELIKQHPQLAVITGEDVTTENWREWLESQLNKIGEYLDVAPLPSGAHQFKHPVDEAVEMGSKNVIALDGTKESADALIAELKKEAAHGA